VSIFPTKVLLATDDSGDSELAATTAVSLAKNTDSEVHVVHVWRPVPSVHFDALIRQEMRREAQEILDEQVKKIEGLGGTVVEAHLREGGTSEEIVTLATEMGVSDAVVRHAHCPVMVVRWKPVAFPAKILLPTDGSEEANLATQIVTDLGERTGSEVHVVHVGEIPLTHYPDRYGYRALYEEHEREARQVLEAQVEKMKAAGATVAQAHLKLGRVDEEVVVLAEELGVDLIAMGGRGLSGVSRALMGSVSDSAVRHAHCPVLIVRN
jgi:nucleotide-binding universal stress UspA family protein